MGADALNYQAAFKAIQLYGTYYMERGFVLLNRLVSRITDQYSGMIIANNLLFFSPLYSYIKKYVAADYWPVCVFVILLQPYIFLQTTFNIVRQECAIGFIIMGMSMYLTPSKSKKTYVLKHVAYILMCLIGAQFHRSAYFALAVPLFFFIKWDKKKWYILLSLSLICNVVNVSVLIQRVASFVGYDQYYDYRASLLNNPLYIVLMTAFILLLIQKYKRFTSSQGDKRLFDLYLFSLIMLIFAVSNDMVYRVYVMFSVIALPALPILTSKVGLFRIRISDVTVSRGLGIVYIAYYLCFFFGYLALLTINNNVAYIPYRFCF